MKIVSLGQYLITADAVPEGARWCGAFRLHLSAADLSVTAPLRDEERAAGTFASRAEAITAALDEARRQLDALLDQVRSNDADPCHPPGRLRDAPRTPENSGW